MEQLNGYSKKKIAIALAVLICVVIGIVALFLPKNSNEPTESKVEPGETITQEQIDRENLDKKPSGPQPSTTPTQTVQPTNDTFYDILSKSNLVAPDNAGNVNFGIIKTQNPIPGWYVVTIKSNNLEPAKVIFHETNDPNNPLTIVAGPGTYFPDSIQLPSAVRKAL